MHISEGARTLARENKQIQSRKSRVSVSKNVSYPGALALATFACGMLTQSETADAVPSFARQTGYYCSTCHTAQPELTPFGRQFKLNGYTQGGTRCGDIRKISGNSMSDPEWSGANLSMWMLPSFNELREGSACFPASLPYLPANNILDFSDASVFFNGQLYCNLGIFSQFSYSSTGSPQGTGQIFWDNTELRYSRQIQGSRKRRRLGCYRQQQPRACRTSGIPFLHGPFPGCPRHSVQFLPDAPGTMIEGQFAQRSYSAGAYVWVNNMFYAELSGYRAYDWNMQQATGFSPIDGQARIDGVAPYWQLAVEKTWNEQSLMVGTYGMAASQMPTTVGTGLLTFPGYTDKFTDVAVDAQYQYIGPIHTFTARAYFIQEWQKLDATYFGGLASGAPGASKPDQTLSSFNVSASYIYDRHISFTADYFDVRGSSDAVYWGGGLSSNNSRPDTNGVSIDLAYIPFPYGGPDLWPWLNARIGILYTHFIKYDGIHEQLQRRSGRSSKKRRG